MKIYTYKQCSTCRKATKWLNEKGIEFEEIAIRENPPTIDELADMLEVYEGEVKRLFNTSGVDYRALAIKDKLPQMNQKEILALLHSNGNLVKRPFLLTDTFKTVGFKETVWSEGFEMIYKTSH